MQFPVNVLRPVLLGLFTLIWCLCNQALADVWWTGAGITYLYCIVYFNRQMCQIRRVL